MAEGLAAAVAYRDLPFADTARFSAFYVLAYSATASLVGGAVAWLCCLACGRRPWPAAVGVGLAWTAILALRGYVVLESYLVFARGETSRAVLVFGAVLGAGASLTILARLLARYRWAAFHRALPISLVLALAAVVVWLVRASPPSTGPGPSAAAGPSSPRQALDPSSTNILLIVIDTLRADHTSPYGYDRDTSPNMSALAARGVTFERCLAQRTNTTPSMASMMTGLYPPTNGVVDAGDALDPSALTMAEMLQERGRTTAAFCANIMAGPRYNFDQGISRFDMLLPGEMVESRGINEAALEWLRQNRADPFFLWLHYMDPHWPYELPEPYQSLYSEGWTPGDRTHFRNWALAARERPGDVTYEISQYDGEIRFNDDSLGSLFSTMDELELWDDTLVILTADHGESLAERDYYFNHGAYCYDNTARVPLILVHPAFEAGRRVSTPVSLIDLMPTLRELLGLPADPSLQGESFAGALFGEELADHRPYHFILSGVTVGYHVHAVSTDQYKLVFDVDGRWIYFDVAVELAARLWQGAGTANPYRSRVIRRELYDIVEDPGETTNLAADRPHVRRRLERELWRWIDDVYADWVPRDPYRSPEELELLRSLGYL